MKKNPNLSTCFEDCIRDLNSTEALEELFESLCERFSFQHITYFCSGFPEQTNTPISITNYPSAWVRHYLEEHCSAIDPVVRKGHSSFLPFDWDKLGGVSVNERRFLEASYDFGLGRYGMTVPVRGPHGETALVSINAATPPSQWWGDRHLGVADFTYFSFLVHRHVARLLSASELGYAPGPSLSPREGQVLSWAAKGKTAWETAQILGISEATVVFYLKNVMAKLGVVTKPQAVAKAIRGNLLRL